MSIQRPTFTLVVGVDEKHLWQLALTWFTWKKHKPEILDWPMIVFYDCSQVIPQNIRRFVDHPNLRTIAWPLPGIGETYPGGNTCKWDDSQRYKMLAGFVHVPPLYVITDYWLKLDTDVVATGQPEWIDYRWFDDDPAIVSHKWTFTKPANQMERLDEWASKTEGVSPEFASCPALELKAPAGATRLGHRRIISWCSFFQTSFSRFTSELASNTCGPGMLPVPSQDGFQWYCAKRMDYPIRRVNMKGLGWMHCSNENNIRKAIKEIELGQPFVTTKRNRSRSDS